MDTPKTFEQLSRALHIAVSAVSASRDALAQAEAAYKAAQDAYNEAVGNAQGFHQELQAHLADLIPGVNTAAKRILHV